MPSFQDLPSHLSRYVVNQNYDRYTSIDQSVWRFIMRQLKHFLSKNAHECYVEGLRKTGISINKIPKIQEMSEKLEEFGWRAVPVSGFIPPAAFMELQAYGYLPIACDMRTLGHLMYTPAPDIVHEAAGHAPILVDPEFSRYLKSYAEVASKAILNKEDLDIYNAIRLLSDLKEDPNATTEQINEAEKKLEMANQKADEPSEAALKDPKIYGAGLLSSVGESRSAVTDKTKKIPFSLECLNYSYDITEPQPQLFVAESFEALTEALRQMSEQMAFKRGGLYGLGVAKKARTINTAGYDSGLQVSGVIHDFMTEDGKPTYIQLKGPSQMSYKNKVLEGHTSDRHPEGFGSPVGNLAGLEQPLYKLNEQQLQEKGIEEGKETTLNFESGIEVTGKVKSFLRVDGRLLVITFTDCTARNGQSILFKPEWGEYDMAVGTEIISVYGGPADRVAYGETEDFDNARVPEKLATEEITELEKLYAKVRFIRENFDDFDDPEQDLGDILKTLDERFKEDWLLRLEILELTSKMAKSPKWKKDLNAHLSKVAAAEKPHSESVRDGLMISDLEL